MSKPAFVSPDLATHLAASGVFNADGTPDREWFDESCERSKRVIELGKAERDRELQRILDGEF